MPPSHLGLSVLTGTQLRAREFHTMFGGQRQSGGVPIMPEGHVGIGLDSATQRRRRGFHHVLDGHRQS
jgi:hypothetical protein